MHRSNYGHVFPVPHPLIRMRDTHYRDRTLAVLQSLVSIMVASISAILLQFSSVLICLPGYSYSHQVQLAARNHGINHGCPSWFIPINNSSDRCKCGEPIHRPGRVVLCDANTNQTMVRITYCMDYNEEEDEVFVGNCPFTNKKAEVQGLEELIDSRTLKKRCALVARAEIQQTQELQDR